MYTFLQFLLGFAAALILVVGGFLLGQATAPSETVDCLNWTLAHFEEPTIGQLALICHGSM
jgi:hypothetical protein